MTQSTNRHITLFHSPQSRSVGAHTLLEELGADYELHVLNLNTKDQRAASYLAINPMGKVPAIHHGDVLVTEQAAIFIYLADLYAEAGLAPALDSPLRGSYLRWMVFYGSCFEPALMDLAMKREAPPQSMSPYDNADTVLKTMSDQLAKGPYMLGERFSALDVLWGMALDWTVGFKLVPETPLLRAYINSITSRPATLRARAKNAELIAVQTAAQKP